MNTLRIDDVQRPVRRKRLTQNAENRNAAVLIAWEEEICRQRETIATERADLKQLRRRLESDRLGLAPQIQTANWLFKSALVTWVGFFLAASWLVIESVQLLPGGPEVAREGAYFGFKALLFTSGWIAFLVNRKRGGDALAHSGGIAWRDVDGEVADAA